MPNSSVCFLWGEHNFTLTQPTFPAWGFEQTKGVAKAGRCCPHWWEPALCLLFHHPPGRGPTVLWDKPTLVVTQLENLLSSSCRHAPPLPIPHPPLLSPPWQPLCFQMFTQKGTSHTGGWGEGESPEGDIPLELSRACGMCAHPSPG